MKKAIRQIIDEWWDLQDSDEFLDYGQGLNINEFVIEDGVRIIWLEDGMHYIAHGEAIRETDGYKALGIIQTLEDYGIHFIEKK